MQFRTTFKIEQNEDFLINHHSQLLTIGSCFSDVLGSQLLEYKFDTICNPFGTVYNPISIFELLQNNFPKMIVENNNNWYSLAHHSAHNAHSYNELEIKLNELHTKVGRFVFSCDYVIITLGTAYAFVHKETNNIVANCHKLPSKLFEKRLLSVNEILDKFDILHKYLLNINPKIKFIFTVSPVRHIKDTMVLNSVSKSILRLVCHHLVQNYTNISYFASYELLLDDLRDYRFYKPDMIHPNEVATEYIWNKFADSHFDIPTKNFVNEWQSILSDLNHKAFNAASEQYQMFISKTLRKIKNLEANIDAEREINMLQSKVL